MCYCACTYVVVDTFTGVSFLAVFVRSGRHYSAISLHSSTMSDGYDFYGNSDSRSRPQSASRLSDVLDVSDSDHNDQRRSNLGQNVALGSRQCSALAWMQQQQPGIAGFSLKRDSGALRPPSFSARPASASL